MTCLRSFCVSSCLVVACGGSPSSDGGGSGDDGGETVSCGPALTSCDGDPIGTWTLVAACEPVDHECVESTAVQTAIEELSGGFELTADGSGSWSASAELDCTFHGPETCVEPEHQQWACPGGMEPCTWNTDCFTPELGGSLVWSATSAGVQLTIGSDEDAFDVELCVAGDEAEGRIDAVADTRDGMRLRFQRMPS